jgi:uncharacterized protein YecT (DUF1311 family)
MRTDRRARTLSHLLAAAALSIAATAAEAAPPTERPPVPAAGAWDVMSVAVDHKDQPHWLYVPDDPRWLGRELTISASALTLNDGSQPCRQPSWTARQNSLGQILAASFSRSPRLGLPVRPVPADFGLVDSANKSVDVMTVHCEVGESAQPWTQAWFVLSSPDRLMMRLDTSMLLILARRPLNAEARSSFSCSSARTPAELTLCRSVALAAFDRSVDAAFRRSLKRQSDAGARLRAEQAEWLKRRDACERDEACLSQTMRERIDELMQD